MHTCSCGEEASTSSSELDVITCGECHQRHHEGCAFDLLKGSCEIAKFALLRASTFRCISCAPERYSWLFQCPCLCDGNVVVDFDDVFPPSVFDIFSSIDNLIWFPAGSRYDRMFRLSPMVAFFVQSCVI